MILNLYPDLGYLFTIYTINVSYLFPFQRNSFLIKLGRKEIKIACDNEIIIKISSHFRHQSKK